MIDKKVAAALADRFSGLDWYPRDGVAQIELIQAVESAENEFIGTYVVTEWIKYETECPKPAEIRRLIQVENQKLAERQEEERQEALSRRGANCPDCHDFGIVESIRGAPIESICRYCSCAAGRRRSAREREESTKYPLEQDAEPKPEEVNAARQKILKLTGSKAQLAAMFRKTTPTRIFGDDYNGEF